MDKTSNRKHKTREIASTMKKEVFMELLAQSMTYPHSKVRSFSMGSWNELQGTHCMEIDVHLAYNLHSDDIIKKVCGNCANSSKITTLKQIDQKTVKWIHVKRVYFQRGDCKIADVLCDMCNLKFIAEQYECRRVENAKMGEAAPPSVTKNKGSKKQEPKNFE